MQLWCRMSERKKGIIGRELPGSDEELERIMNIDDKKLAYPRLKLMFDILLVSGAFLLALKLLMLLLGLFTSVAITMAGGKLLWNLGPLGLMVVGGIGSEILKKKYKQEQIS